MIDCCLLRWGTAEDLGLPGVEVAVEVDHRDLAVGTVDRTEEGKDDGVVTSKGDNARMMFAVRRDRHQRLSGRRVVPESREGSAVKELLVTVLDLFDGKLVIVRRHRYITAVDDLQP